MIKHLDIKDIGSIIPMCKDFFTLAEEPGEFNEAHFIKTWQEIYNSRRGLILVEMKEETPISMLGFIGCPDMCSGDLTLEETFFYADPSEKTRAFQLVNMMGNIGKEIGAKVLYLKHTAHLEEDRLERIYNRKGFVKKFIRYEKVL